MNEQLHILVQRLKEAEISTQRFLKVGPDKAAFEFEFQKKLYGPEDLDSQTPCYCKYCKGKQPHKMWGILGKEFLVLVDTDTKEMYDLLSKVLPETFEVTSPRRGLPHKYFCVCYGPNGEEVPNKTLYIEGNLDEKGRVKGEGEVRAQNEYLVAPDTEITFKDRETGEETTGKYTITKNIPIARLEYADFMAAVQPYIGKNSSDQKITDKEMKIGVGSGFRHAKTMSYAYHLIAVVRLGEALTLQELIRFGKLCSPPLEDQEYFKRAINAAIRKEAEVTGKTEQYFREGTELRVVDELIQTQEKTVQVLEHINAIENSELIEQPIQVEGVISSTSIAYPTPQEIKLKEIIKTEEGETDYIDNTAIFESNNPLNLSLVGITKETQIARLKNYFLPKKIIITDVIKYRIIYMIRIRPPVFTLEKQGDKLVDEKGYEYKYLDLYVTSNKPLTFEPSTLLRITGLPLPHPRTQKTTILAYNVEFPETNFSYDTEKMSTLKTVFAEKTVKERLNWILENFELYSHIVERKNIATATLLTYFSPLYIKLNGDTQRGWVITAIIGDTTTAKSETVKKFSKLLKSGSIITAETASTVGLTGTATQLDREGWFIDWGFLPLMDRKLLAIDGSHKLSASSWAALAEAERSGVLSIAKAAKNTTYARTRQLRIYNAVDQEVDKYSTKSLSSFLYPIQALTTVLDKTSIARQDIAVFSDQRDVPPELINKKINQTPDQHLEILSEVLKWTWNTKTTIEWTENAVTTLLNEATNLYKNFFYEAIPLVSIDQKNKIARLSAALAYCTLSTNADFSVVTVTEEHVKTIIEFLTNEYTKAGLGLLSQEQQFEKLEEADVREIFLRILEKVNLPNLHEILHFIVTANRITKDTLKTKFELTDKTELRPLLSVLQNERLIKTGKGGFYPTTSLIEAYKLTNGFATLATLATPKNTPPSPPKLGAYINV